MSETDRKDRVRKSMRASASRTREVADEMAAMYDGCDDPMLPWNINEFRDWQDFVDRVARPLVEAEGDEVAIQTAMKLYRKESPYFICVAMVMMDNRIKATLAGDPS